jgi:hypothetical protein
MAMFTRRALQRAIDGSLAYTSRSKRREWVGVLNSPKSPRYIPTEWEIMVLQSLSGLGTLTHEQDLGGETKPDVHFKCPSLTFVADIATISDRGSHERNPIRQLEVELRQRWLRSGVTEGGFAFHASTRLETGRGGKPPVIVPPVEQFDSLIFNDRFERFVCDVKTAPNQQRALNIPWAINSVIQITYVPGRKFVWCTGHTSYTIPTQRDRNPLYLALKDKADQLKRCGFSGTRGVIICDGGAQVLRNLGDTFSYSVRDIVFHALKRHTSIDFVVILSLGNRSMQTIRQDVGCELFVRDVVEWGSQLYELVNRMVEQLPEVIQTPDNARSDLAHWIGKEKQHTHIGAVTYTVGRNGVGEIRMLTRTLLEVLGGRLPVKKLNESYSLNKREGIFEHQLRRGSVIESVRVEKKPDEDSDEIVFTFGLPDPSAAPFTDPEDHCASK